MDGFKATGRIFYLSGLTSTGKTSIINELVSRREWRFCVLGFDMFEEAIPQWAYSDSAYSDAIRAMYHAARSLCRSGHDVIIDGLIMNLPGLEQHYTALKEILEGCPLRLIRLICSPEELRRRNENRGDRRFEQSEAQAKFEEQSANYELTLNTETTSIKQCADILLAFEKSERMSAPTIARVTHDNFSYDSMDGFVRTQRVTDVYCKIDGEYRVISHPFTDDWTAERKREMALEMLSDEYITYAAFDADRVVGFVMLAKELNKNRMIVDSFHVSAECRHRGIGRMLFETAKAQGRKYGADKLYFSACSSVETIGFYRAMGCVLSDDIIAEMAEDEPYDLQLECSI